MPAPGPPVSVTATYAADLNIAAGGSEHSGSAALGRIAILADADLQRLIGIRSAKAHVSVIDIFGTGLSASRIDNLAAASGIEAPMSAGGYLTLLLLIVVIGSAVSQLLDSTITIVVVGPIIIQLAQARGLSPQPLMIALALSASLVFMMPFSHRANLLVMAIGGYTFKDFFRVGTLLTLLLATGTVCAILLWQ